MIILTAGHTGTHTGAQCITTQFDEGAETIWLRNQVAEILTNKYGLVVLMDDDTVSLKLLTKALSENLSHTDNTQDIKTCLLGRDFAQQKQDHYVKEKSSYVFLSKKPTSTASPTLHPTPCSLLIDLHFNAHTNPQARGTETIVADDATELELRMASRLAHTTSDALNIPLRGIKSESQTPHKRLAMLHLTPQSIILEVCFCTSPEDVEQYRRHRRKIASTIARTIAELILDMKTR